MPRSNNRIDDEFRKEMSSYLLSDDNERFNEDIRSYLNHKAGWIHSINMPNYWMGFLYSGIRHAPYGDPIHHTDKIHVLKNYGSSNPIFEERNNEYSILVVENDSKVFGIKISSTLSAEEWSESEKAALHREFKDTGKQIFLKKIRISRSREAKFEIIAKSQPFSEDEALDDNQRYTLVRLESEAYNFHNLLREFSSHDEEKVRLAIEQYLANFHELLKLDKQAIAGRVNAEPLIFSKEALLHGYLDGMLSMNFRQKYHLQIQSELIAGRGYIDLGIISTKAKNWHAIPIIIELKITPAETAQSAMSQIKRQWYDKVAFRARTISKKRVLVGFNPNFSDKESALLTQATSIPEVSKSSLNTLLDPHTDTQKADSIIGELLLDTIPSNGGANQKYHSIPYLLLGQTLLFNDQNIERHLFIPKSTRDHANMAILFKNKNNGDVTILETSMKAPSAHTRHPHNTFQPDYRELVSNNRVRIIRCKISSHKRELPVISVVNSFQHDTESTRTTEGRFIQLNRSFDASYLDHFIDKGIFDGTVGDEDRAGVIRAFYEKINEQLRELVPSGSHTQRVTLFPDEASIQYMLTGAYTFLRDNTQKAHGNTEIKRIQVYPEYQAGGGKIDLVIQGVKEYQYSDITDGDESSPIIHEFKYMSSTSRKHKQAQAQLAEYESYTKSLFFGNRIFKVTLTFDKRNGEFFEFTNANNDEFVRIFNAVDHTSAYDSQESDNYYGSPVKKRPRISQCASSNIRFRRTAEGSSCLFSGEDLRVIEVDDYVGNEKSIDATKLITHLKKLSRAQKEQLIRLARTRNLISQNDIDYRKSINVFKALNEPNKIDELIYDEQYRNTEASNFFLEHNLSHDSSIRSKLLKLNRLAGRMNIGFMSEDFISELARGDWKELSINLIQNSAQYLTSRTGDFLEKEGTRLLTQDGASLLGRITSVSGIFISKIPSIFTGYAFVEGIESLQKGFKNATESVVVNGAQLAIDVTEIGIKTVELFGGEAVEAVSAFASELLGPAAMLIVLGDRIYKSVERVEAIEKVLPLTPWEEFKEGVNGFLGFDPSFYIQDLMEEKECNNQITKNRLNNVKNNTHIKYYFFSVCNDVGATSINHIVDLTQQHRSLSRAAPDMPNDVELICFAPSQNGYRSNEPIYNCSNVVGVEFKGIRQGHTAFFDLGFGIDTVHGFMNYPNVFTVGRSGEEKFYTGGSEDDLFIVTDGADTKILDGGGGATNILKLMLPDSQPFYSNKQTFFKLRNIQVLEGRKDKDDSIHVYHHQFNTINGLGGTDNIYINQPNMHQLSQDERAILRQLYDTRTVLRVTIHEYTTVHIKHTLTRELLFEVLPSKGLARIRDHSHHTLTNKIRYLKWKNNLKNLNGIDIRTDTLIHSLDFVNNGHLSVMIQKRNIASKVTYISILQDGTYFFQDRATNEMYAAQVTDQPLRETLSQHRLVPDRARINLIFKAPQQNASAIMGYGQHNVLSNPLTPNSYLFGGNGNDIYKIVLPPEITQSPLNSIMTINIDNFATDEGQDLLDLREVNQRGKMLCPNTWNDKLNLTKNNVDIVIKSGDFRCDFFEIIIIDYFIDQNHQHIYIKLENTPLQIIFSPQTSSLTLEALPITLEKNLTVIDQNDVSNGSSIIFQVSSDEVKLLQKENNLFVTNSIRVNYDNAQAQTLILKNYYNHPIMQTLSLHFKDKIIYGVDLKAMSNHAMPYYFFLENIVMFDNSFHKIPKLYPSARTHYLNDDSVNFFNTRKKRDLELMEYRSLSDNANIINHHSISSSGSADVNVNSEILWGLGLIYLYKESPLITSLSFLSLLTLNMLKNSGTLSPYSDFRKLDKQTKPSSDSILLLSQKSSKEITNITPLSTIILCLFGLAWKKNSSRTIDIIKRTRNLNKIKSTYKKIKQNLTSKRCLEIVNRNNLESLRALKNLHELFQHKQNITQKIDDILSIIKQIIALHNNSKKCLAKLPHLSNQGSLLGEIKRKINTLLEFQSFIEAQHTSLNPYHFVEGFYHFCTLYFAVRDHHAISMYSYEEWETFLQREEESIETKLINIAINEKIAVDLLSDYSQTHKEYLSGECKKYDLHTMFQTTRRCLNKLTDVNSKNLYQCQGTITA